MSDSWTEHQTYTESDLSITISRPHLKYDEDGPGSRVRYCHRKEADFVILGNTTLFLVEVKRDAWFTKLLQGQGEDGGRERDKKVCELTNTFLDTLSGLWVTGELTDQDRVPTKNQQIATLVLVNRQLHADQWSVIDDIVKAALTKKFKRTVITDIAVDHAGGSFPKWFAVAPVQARDDE
jgi:hypothetical protein